MTPGIAGRGLWGRVWKTGSRRACHRAVTVNALPAPVPGNQEFVRLGLCCGFVDADIKFRTSTLTYCKKLPREKRLTYLSSLVLHNSQSLLKALEECHEHSIGCFRVNSSFCPLITHADVGYRMDDLPDFEEISRNLATCRVLKDDQNLRLAMHPDQFVVLNSPKEEIVANSVAELEYHAMIGEAIGVDVINIHGGGVYGDKKSALDRFAKNFDRLSPGMQSKLTLENDDRSFTPTDLLPLCKKIGVPMVYDVHHHRCNHDGVPIPTMTEQAIESWNREPLFHISSPATGWEGGNPRPHHNLINPCDYPDCWENLKGVTVEVEAKLKDRAVKKLMKQLSDRKVGLWKTNAQLQCVG
ncbi:hypothetical protein BSKO_00931 [Bryopsis sp. KO-2023]|nr:hypothetical protein BSKO_00931 [Bryopsis sp. KO-2023]